MFGTPAKDVPQAPASRHAPYLEWSSESDLTLRYDVLRDTLQARPSGLFRFKGFVCYDGTSTWEVQCVGPSVDIKTLNTPQKTRVVGIGLRSLITNDEIDAWWTG